MRWHPKLSIRAQRGRSRFPASGEIVGAASSCSFGGNFRSLRLQLGEPVAGDHLHGSTLSGLARATFTFPVLDEDGGVELLWIRSRSHVDAFPQDEQ